MAVAPILTMVGSSTVGSAVSGVVGQMVNPLTHAISQTANYQSPLVMPSPEQIITLFHGQHITAEELRDQLRYFGIPDAPSTIGANGIERGFIRQVKALWDRVIEISKPQPPMDYDLTRYYRGYTNWDNTYRNLRRYGFGRMPEIDRLLDVPNPMPVESLLVARNRGKIDDTYVDRSLRAHGFGSRVDRIHLSDLRYQVPGVNDIIRYAVREVWDNDVVQRFGYDNELPEALRYWADKTGFAYRPSDQFSGIPTGTDIPFYQAEWRSHWNMLSPFQAGTAVHMLRNGIPADEQSGFPAVPPFTPADFERIMRIADYPPIIRSWLFGLSYQRPGRRDMLRLRRLNVWSKSQVREGFRDLGFTAQTAEAQAESVEREIARSKQSRGRARLIGALRNMLEEGIITGEDFVIDTYRIGLDTQQQLADFDSELRDTQQRIALRDPEVRKELDEATYKRIVKRFRYVKQTLRRLFSKGKITADEALQRLRQAGMGGTQARQEIESWQLAMVDGRREATTSQISKWVETGVIKVDEALRRLDNLGYSKNDAGIIIGLARDNIAASIARLEEKQARVKRDRQRAIQNQIKEMRREIADAQKRLTKDASKAEILRFLKAGMIDQSTATIALIQRGFSPGLAQMYAQLGERSGDKVPGPEAPLGDLVEIARQSDDILAEGEENGEETNNAGQGEE